MVDRVYFGLLGGAFVCRVSKPGHDVKTASQEDLLFDENTTSLYPLREGSLSFGGRTSKSVNISGLGLTGPPVITLKSSDGRPPCDRTYYARVSYNLNSFRVHNEDGATRTVEYYIYNGIT